MFRILSILLYPFSILYGTITYIRNKFFDWQLLRSVEFNFPVIVVGNLNTGGVGKTPHVEYLIKLLSNYKIAALSRGYKRKTKGFVIATPESDVNELGDEPLQFYRKFKDLTVCVDENRVNGIQQIKKLDKENEIIILDDAYQHRSVKPGINILITDYSKMYINDLVLPSGRLREWGIGSKRADIIIVSKTPPVLSPIDIRRIKSNLNPEAYQEIFFTYTKYGNLTPFINKNNIEVNSKCSILLVTGIAKPSDLYYKVKHEYKNIEHLTFSDHHNFTNENINSVKDKFNNLYGSNKIIITTEKDIMRLSLPTIKEQLEDLPIFYIPIEICFHGNGGEEFDDKILKYVEANRAN